MGGIVGNRYYNNPQIGQAFQNLAQMYAPPGARALASLAQADARRQEATRLQQLFESGATPSESAALAGVQGYGQTPQGFTYGVDTEAETARYGYDQSLAGTKYTADQNLKGDVQTAGIAADAARYGHDQSLRGSQFDTLYGALGEGEVRPAIPANEAAMFGLEGAIGGAGISEHLHQHVVPRWMGDSNFLPIIAKTKALPELLDETWQRLRAAWPSDGA